MTAHFTVPAGSAQDPAEATAAPARIRLAAALAAAPVAFGIAWRLLRYGLDFPVWGDEAMLALNVLDGDPARFLEPLRYNQVAPFLFLLAEKAIGSLLGYSGQALRLLPLLAAILGVAAFGALARRLLDPLAAALATGALAVSYYPVRQACEVKPYSLDLAFSALLLLLAVAWRQAPRSRAAPLLLVLVVPVATGSSFPSVFVAGAVSLALIPSVVLRGDTVARALWGLFNLLLVTSFAAFQLLVGTTPEAGEYLRYYWAAAFPPADPLALAGWLVSTHLGPVLAHPWGGNNAGSFVTTLLSAAGLAALARRRDRALLVLLLGPFALTLVAAALRRYPYGGAPRLAQHLAPPVCLLLGAGLADLVLRLGRTEAARRRAAAALLSGLCLFASGGMLRDVLKPYKAAGDRAAAELVKRLQREAAPPSVVVLVGGERPVPASVEYLFRVSGLDVSGGPSRPWAGVPPGASRVVVVRFGVEGSDERRLLDELAASRPPFVAGPAERLFFRFGWSHDPPVAAILTVLRREPEG